MHILCYICENKPLCITFITSPVYMYTVYIYYIVLWVPAAPRAALFKREKKIVIL